MDFDFRSFLQSAHRRPSKPDNSLKKLVQEFYQHVERSITTRPSTAGVEKFKLAVNLAGPGRASLSHLDRWLGFAEENHVWDLVLSCFSACRPGNYCNKHRRRWPYLLPQPLVRALPSLKSLDLFGCWFLEHDCRYSNNNVGRFSLTKLRLSHVFVGQETLETMLSSCDLLTELSIYSCKGFEVVRVPQECQKLEAIDFYLGRDREIQIVSVLATNVRLVSYGGNAASVRGSLTASNFFECLKKLKLHDSDITDEFFLAVPEFGRLEKVVIERCGFLENVRISGGRVMELSVSECVMLKRIELDSHCLRLLKVDDSGCDVHFLQIDRSLQEKLYLATLINDAYWRVVLLNLMSKKISVSKQKNKRRQMQFFL